jgi:hypothetical protein
MWRQNSLVGGQPIVSIEAETGAYFNEITQMMASQKIPNCCVALHPSSLRRTVCTPLSSGFARLAFGAFCLAIPSVYFCGIITEDRREL